MKVEAERAIRLMPGVHAVESVVQEFIVFTVRFRCAERAWRQMRMEQSTAHGIPASTLRLVQFIRAPRQRFCHLPELPPEKLSEVREVSVMPGTFVPAVVFPIATAPIGLGRLALARAAVPPPARLPIGVAVPLCRRCALRSL